MMGATIPPRHMRTSPKARPLTVAELVELRDLKRELGQFMAARRALGPFVPAKQAARLMGLETRTVLNLVRRGFFPGAWKPSENRVHLLVSEVEAYIEARRVRASAPEGVES